MFRRSLPWMAVSVLGLAMALFATSRADAGIFFNRGGGYYGPAYNGYYGNGYSGYYGNGYYSGYDAYAPWYGYSSYPTTNGWAYQPATTTYSSGYAGLANVPQHGDGNISPRAALIDVRLPADAELWFGDDKTFQTGMMREFVTPDLRAADDNTYTVRALWVQNGRAVTQTRQVKVGPGARVMVDFYQPANSGRSVTQEPAARPRIEKTKPPADDDTNNPTPPKKAQPDKAP